MIRVLSYPNELAAHNADLEDWLNSIPGRVISVVWLGDWRGIRAVVDMENPDT